MYPSDIASVQSYLLTFKTKISYCNNSNIYVNMCTSALSRVYSSGLYLNCRSHTSTRLLPLNVFNLSQFLRLLHASEMTKTQFLSACEAI